MNSIYDYIVKPLGERYNNTKKVGNKNLILNTKIENFKVINKKAIVISTPTGHELPIKKGDIVYIHHNVFRKYYNMKGKQQNSRSYFEDDMYFCSPDQIYLYERNNKRYSFLDRCFVKPLSSSKLGEKTLKNIGVIKYGNKLLSKLGVSENDIVSFPDKRNWEFVVNGELLYCMKSKDILLKHERQGNEKEYNSSSATCCEGTNKSCKRTNSRHGGRCDCGSFEKCRCNKEISYI